MPEEASRSKSDKKRDVSTSPDSSRSASPSSEKSTSSRRSVSRSPSGAKSPPLREKKRSRAKSKERSRKSKRSTSREKKRHSSSSSSSSRKSSRHERGRRSPRRDSSERESSRRGSPRRSPRRDSPDRRRRESFPGGDKSRLYVGDLLPHLREDDLKVLFSPHGELVEVSLQQKPQDNGLNFGFVQFRTAEQAARAMRHLADVTIDNQPVKIELARPKKRDLEQLQPRPAAFNAQQQMMAMSQMWPGFAAMQAGFGALPGMANWVTPTHLDTKPKYRNNRSRSRDRDRYRKRDDDRNVQIEVMSEGGKRTVHRGDHSPSRKRDDSERWKPSDKSSRRSSRSRSPEKKKSKRDKSRSRSRSSSPTTDDTRVIISNISRKVTEDELKAKLERFGKLRSFKFQQNDNSRGAADVTFASADSAEGVLKEAIFINNKRLEIEPFRSTRSSANDTDQEDEDIVPNRLHVRNLAFATSPKGLKAYFKQFGDVEEAWVVDDPKTGKSKGVGFVEFKTQEGAARAMKEESHELDGRTIHPHYAKLSAEFNIGQGLSATRLHMSNLPSDVTSKEVRKYFLKFGNVTDLFLVPGKEGKTTGVGFVEFATHKEAASCIRVTRHVIGDMKLTVAYARLRPGEGQPGAPVPVSAYPSVFNTPLPFPSMPFFPSMMANPFLFPPRLSGMGTGFPFPGLPVPPKTSRGGRGRGPKS